MHASMVTILRGSAQAGMVYVKISLNTMAPGSRIASQQGRRISPCYSPTEPSKRECFCSSYHHCRHEPVVGDLHHMDAYHSHPADHPLKRAMGTCGMTIAFHRLAYQGSSNGTENNSGFPHIRQALVV